MELSFSSTGLSEGASSLVEGEYFTVAPSPAQDESPSAFFYIPVAGTYSLDVYDISGRVVLHQGYDNLPAGEHSMLLDTSSLPSAVYLCILSRDEFQSNSKMIIIND